jgi:cell wall-associated NlpC family hydrolase
VLGSIAVGLAVTGTALVCAVPFLLTTAMADDQSRPSTVALGEIPGPLLNAYREAPACQGLPWQVIAGIGWTESHHGTIRGARLDPASGDTTPPIVGVALDGGGTAAVPVPRSGSPWHGDRVWDHAVGPMQFITTTWAAWGIDASGDGNASPHNAYDAIATAGRFLCNNRDQLPDADAVQAAIRRYNNSTAYVDAVLDKAYAYGMTDGGDPVVPGALAAGPAGRGPTIRGDAGSIVAYARAQLGDPYVWGAEGPDAFDCSGLTLAAYRTTGIRLPHRSARQVRYGRAVNWRSEPIRPSDLLFLRGGKPVHDYGHVGIATSSSTWINAPRTGLTVNEADIPFRRIQAVRRLVE